MTAQQSRPTIKAVVVNPKAEGHLALGDVAAPVPAPDEALVRVAAISLNRGEVRRSASAEAGWRPGWDLAGTVETAASDGSGPPAGTRVVGLLPEGAWAELVAVPANSLAPLPDEVSHAQAATLPVAGLTALYSLEKGGSLLGRSVLITGASGGVGHLAVQLARLAGARVAGLVHQERHAEFVRDAGAHEVVAGDDGLAAAAYAPYHLIVESVGGVVLGNLLGMLAPRGICVSCGVSAGEPTVFNTRLSFGASLYRLRVFQEMAGEPPATGLSRLVRLVAAGRLRPEVAVESPWTEIGKVAQGLIERHFPGKAVLHLDEN